MILSSSILFLLLPVLAKQHYGFVFAVRALQGLVEVTAHSRPFEVNKKAISCLFVA